MGGLHTNQQHNAIWFAYDDFTLHELSETTERKHDSSTEIQPIGALRRQPPRRLAGAAGLFDGDGCVHISKQTRPGRKHPTYRFCLSLCVISYAKTSVFEEAQAVAMTMFSCLLISRMSCLRNSWLVLMTFRFPLVLLLWLSLLCALETV